MSRNDSLKYILTLFILSRIFLSSVGVLARIYLAPIYGGWHEWQYSDNLALDIWGVWDTGWYLDIAEGGYSATLNSELPKKVCCGQNNLGFFPLYPVLIKALGHVIRNNFLSGIIISNLSLLVSAYLIFRISDKKDLAVAKRAVKFLFLFPTSFILSGVFSESLFLMLLVLVYYMAERKNYMFSSVAGFLLGLTKPIAIFAVLSILIGRERRKNVLVVLTTFLGTVSFMIFTFLKFGDFLAYYHSQSQGWGNGLVNPLPIIFNFYKSGDLTTVIISTFICSLVFLIIYFRKYLHQNYMFLCIVLLGSFLVSGSQVLFSFPRLSIVVFPIYILLAQITSKKEIDFALSACFVIIQTFFMICWVNGALII